MNQRLSTSLLLGVVLAVSVFVAFALAGGSNGVALAGDDVSNENEAPDVGPITAPLDPVPVNTEITVSAVFTDPDVLDTHTAEWDWGDGITSPGLFDEANPWEVTGGHNYDTPNVYTVKLTVTDKADDSGESLSEYLIVYDPNGGFVTGGGWIDSPAGAYADDLSLSGKATFGFVSKYKKGANTPTGNTEFQFKAGDLDFHSSSYERLFVTGSNYAKFKGTGTINGEGEYKFKLWAGDDDPDTFRIKIWWEEGETEHVVYDNGMDQPIGGGSVVVHTGKK